MCCHQEMQQDTVGKDQLFCWALTGVILSLSLQTWVGLRKIGLSLIMDEINRSSLYTVYYNGTVQTHVYKFGNFYSSIYIVNKLIFPT